MDRLALALGLPLEASRGVPADASTGAALALLGLLALAVLALVLAERVLLSPRRILTPDDAIGVPGRRLTLRARVERDLLPWWDPPVAGVPVRFHVGDSTLAGVTGPDGRAEIDLPPLPAGLHRFRVECGLAPESEGLIDVSDRPALVVDIDRTIAESNQLTFMLLPADSIAAVKDAPETLATLADRYRIVYLTARDHRLREKTRGWLRLRRFPEAPLVLRRTRFWWQKAVDHKRERLEELAADTTLAAGVGDAEGDVTAYRERQMNAIRYGVDARTWGEVAARL